ncbi:hypothetical protein HC031_00710 [Planosporangium thailandense]|uniref:Lipoprotein n=1 Tax=Planosporangium thailandense TaxID=765197 RepID=A0ABX0XS40_9ACTN|nr:hypothetical protein [Planosporangium thailandense]NJC68245.1 hypothetical protein [Planosporangium thailandense]
MRTGEKGRVHSRRAVLAAAVGLAGVAATGACDDPGSAASHPVPPDPLNPFYRDTAALLGRYEATIAAQPGLAGRLGPIRDAHRAHLQALAREIGPGLDAQSSAAPSAGASGDSTGPQPAPLTSLLAAEKQAASAARSVCLTAPSYRAALLGSIAAARATHVVVLS